MKQLLILDRQFNVKKIGLVKTSPTIFDTISPQKTTLELLKDESVNIGNIISIKQYDKQEFLGIVQDVAVKDKTELYVYPFINAFNCECTMESINGYVYDWIVATMEANFVNIVDNSLKLNLEFRNMMTLQPSLSYIFSDGNLFEALKKIFYITGVYLEFSLKFVNGIATAIYCDVYNTNDYDLITIRHDNPLLGVEKPVIENSMNYGTNKIILKPEEGASGSTYAFYLLEDNTVTTNQGASGRLTPVNQKIARYAEGTSSLELQLIAEKELLGEAYDHNIYFTIKRDDSYKFELYRKVKFISEDRTYISYCSKIDKTQDNVLGITLGVIRNNLTAKIKELEAQTSSLSSATSSGSGAIIPVLQWGNIGGSINNQADLKNALAGKIPTTEKGAVNGVATLGADGKLTSTQMPSIRVTDVYVVASQSEMLALEADEGDVAKRTDLGKSFILNSGSPTILSNWLPMVDDFEPLGAVSDHNASETAHSTLFGVKVDKVAGKGLSTNDLTSELKTAYDGAVTDSHTHSNKTTLDNTTASYTTEEATKLSGIEDNTVLIKNENGGFSAGYQSTSTFGGAVGNSAHTTHGAAVGSGSNSTYGGAVGFGTMTTDGFAGGKSAITATGTTQLTPIDAIQLGTGQNAVAGSLQVYGNQLLDASGKIPDERLSENVAMVSDIPSNFVDLTTAQTIAGIKTFSDDLKLSKKLYVGTMQTIYNAEAEDGFTGCLFFGNGGGSLSHTIFNNGYYNTGIGNNSVYSNTTGYSNTGVGNNSVYSNTTGYSNTGVGDSSLKNNTSSLNTGIGSFSLVLNTTGNTNTGIGYYSLRSNTTGSGNVGIGSSAGYETSSSMQDNTITNNSVFIGKSTKALYNNQTNQIVIGYDTTGHGSNTATIGNIDITDNYFNGNLHLTGTLKNATNTFTLPSATGTLALTSQIPSLTNYVTKDGEATLTNKTLTAPKISSISNTGVLTLPTATGTLALTSDIPAEYTLPTASTTVLGGVKIDGTSITISDGVISSTASGSGTVTSVGITAGSGISVSNSPITTSGNITVNNTGVLSVNGGAGAITGIATTTQLATKAVQPYIQRSYGAGNGVRLIGTYNYSTSVGDTRPLFYLAGKQGHGNGVNYLWQGEFIFGVATTGAVTAKSILTISDGTFGKFYYRHDTVNKILYLYVYTGQYSSAYFSDLIQINAGNYSSYFTLASASSVTTDTIVEGVNLLYPATSGTMALTSQIPVNSSFTLADLSEKNFSSLENKPTTISGYGITDAVTLSNNQTIAGIKTFSSSPIVPDVTIT